MGHAVTEYDADSVAVEPGEDGTIGQAPWEISSGAADDVMWVAHTTQRWGLANAMRDAVGLIVGDVGSWRSCL